MTPARANELLPIITAFATGKQIQVRVLSGWLNIDHPGWDEKCDYRIKPDAKWYRVAKLVNQTTIAHGKFSEADVESLDCFDRWLTNRVEYDV